MVFFACTINAAIAAWIIHPSSESPNISVNYGRIAKVLCLCDVLLAIMYIGAIPAYYAWSFFCFAQSDSCHLAGTLILWSFTSVILGVIYISMAYLWKITIPKFEAK